MHKYLNNLKPLRYLFNLDTLKKSFIKTSTIALFIFIIFCSTSLSIRFSYINKWVFTEKSFNVNTPNDLDIFDTFKCTEDSFICNNSFILVVIGILISEFIIHWFLYLNRRHQRKRKLILKWILFQFFILVSLVIIILLFTSFVYVYFNHRAKMELINAASIISNVDTYKDTGLIRDREEILKNITSSDFLPVIIGENVKDEALLEFLNYSKGENLTFFKAIIVPNYLYNHSYLTSNIDFNYLYFPKGVLLLNDLTLEDLNYFLPIISRKLLYENYTIFIDEELKDPSVYFLFDGEYVQYRKKEEQKYTDNLTKVISELNSYIAEDMNLINKNKDFLGQYDDYVEDLDKDYKKYVTDQQKDYDRFCTESLGTKDSDDCKKLKKIISENKNTIDDNRKYLETEKELSQKYINISNSNITYYRSEISEIQKRINDHENNPLTPEFQAGVYDPNTDSIYIKYENNENLDIEYYLVTTLHEYLHHLANKYSNLDTFLDEGITDFLTNESFRSIQKYENSNQYIGYTEEVAIIERLLIVIPKIDLLATYFSNDVEFKDLFEKYYQNNSYDDFISFGSKITFIPIEENSASRDSALTKVFSLLDN